MVLDFGEYRSVGVAQHGFDKVSNSVRRICRCILRCPICVAFFELLVLLGGLGAALSQMSLEVESNFESFKKTDITSSILQDSVDSAIDALVIPQRRLADSSSFKNVWLTYELQGTGPQSNLFLLQAQLAIAKFEQHLTALPEWQELCNLAKSHCTGEVTSCKTACDPGHSVANYLLPTQTFQVGNIIPIQLELDGKGDSLLPLWTSLMWINKDELQEVLLPKDFNASLMKTTLLRSLFRFRLRSTQDRSLASLKEQWLKLLDKTLLPYLRDRQQLSLFNGDDIQVYYDGSDFQEQEVFYALQQDLMLAIGSFSVCLAYLVFHTRSVVKSVLGLLMAIISVPWAYVITSWISGSAAVSFSYFLAVFIVMGFGSDVIFVYNDTWVDSKEHFGDNLEERIIWTLVNGGRASFVTTSITALSFLANLASVIRALRQLGFFMGLCVLLCWIFITLLYLPLCPAVEICSRSPRCQINPTRGMRHKCFKVWALHLRRWRWPYFVIPLTTLFGLLVVAILQADMNFSTIELFPEDHNRVRSKDSVDKFEELLEYPSAKERTVQVCGDIGPSIIAESASTCDLYWCDAQQLPVVSPGSFACFRRPNTCVGETAAVAMRLFSRVQQYYSVRDHALSAISANSMALNGTAYVEDTWRTLLQYDWSVGVGFRAEGMDYKFPTMYNSSHNYPCGWSDLCFEEHICDMRNEWQALPSINLTGSTENLVRLLQGKVIYSTGQARMVIVFGLSVKQELSLLGHENADERWSFSPGFNPKSPWAQRNLYTFCANWDSTHLGIAKYWCWMKRFKDFLDSEDRHFPSLNFHADALRFIQAIPVYNKYAWFEGGEVKAIYNSVHLTLQKTEDADTALEYKKRWDTYLDEYRADATVYGKPVFHVSNLWVDAEAQGELIISTAQTLITLIALAFAGMFAFTCSVRLSLFVVLATTQVVFGLFFFVIVVLNWAFGLIEVVALIYYMGYALTYSLHIAHKYGSSNIPEKYFGGAARSSARDTPGTPSSRLSMQENLADIRFHRVSWSLRCMGAATLGSALTTAGASVFLLFSTLTVFMKLGYMCFLVTILSVIVALVPLPALLLISGPRHSIGCFHRVRRCSQNWRTCKDQGWCSCRWIFKAIESFKKKPDTSTVAEDDEDKEAALPEKEPIETRSAFDSGIGLEFNSAPRAESNSGATPEFTSGARTEVNSGARPEFNSGARGEFNSGTRPGFNSGIGSDFKSRTMPGFGTGESEKALPMPIGEPESEPPGEEISNKRIVIM